MRIWDLPPEVLCRKHLLGEHRELHAIWSIITHGKNGYSKHPETLRWNGKLAALYKRHEALVAEMGARWYFHRSPLDEALATGNDIQDVFVDEPSVQYMILKSKRCECDV